MPFRLCSLAPRISSEREPSSRRFFGGFDFQFAAQILRRERLASSASAPRKCPERRLRRRVRPRRDRCREFVGRQHHLGFVLDDQHRVADVAQVLENRESAIVVARMQTDRRLIENVQRADER